MRSKGVPSGSGLGLEDVAGLKTGADRFMDSPAPDQ